MDSYVDRYFYFRFVSFRFISFHFIFTKSVVFSFHLFSSGFSSFYFFSLHYSSLLYSTHLMLFYISCTDPSDEQGEEKIRLYGVLYHTRSPFTNQLILIQIPT